MRAASVPLLWLLAAVAQTAPPAAIGDPAVGKALFEGRAGCSSCHSLDEPAGGFGPDLTWIGILRTPEALRRSLIDPDNRVSTKYFTVIVETKSGQRIEGLGRHEDDRSIQIRDTRGQLHAFAKADLKALTREERSLMPSYAQKLSPAELDHLVAYLRSLRSMWPVEPQERTREIGSVSENIAFFDRPERDADEQPDRLIEALEIPEGATVADLGAGTGYFTWRLARRVGARGKVIAIDIQQRMLDLTAARVRQHELTNVQYVLATHKNPRLPEGSMDLVFIAYAYHEFADPEASMAAVRRSLKPGGRVFILEFASENRSAPASSQHKMSLEEIRAEIEPLGFELDRLLDFPRLQHGLIFKKRPSP